MRKFGLIGYPLSHSFSQKYFTEKFQREGIDAEYCNFPIESLDELDDIIRREPDLVGLNVTIPYKTAIIPRIELLQKCARSIQSVNTVTIERRGSDYVLHGANTDVIGFKESIEQHVGGHDMALILGTGGAAKAAFHVLEDLGLECESVSRSPDEGDFVYDELTTEDVWEHSIIVNCTPLGMYPQIDAAPDIPYESITPEHVLYDMIYNPAETVFLKHGRKRGATTINGLQMLERQAEESWKIWNK
ncbi:MAG: shikimate dehydrogenase [Flavobacteriales bacterium]|nr:shikimate dehydrogenase [Flavobacteriales bacterium]MCB9203827.1 shikimate dehydrogenase [Flavobacteriales bacterium]